MCIPSLWELALSAAAARALAETASRALWFTTGCASVAGNTAAPALTAIACTCTEYLSSHCLVL